MLKQIGRALNLGLALMAALGTSLWAADAAAGKGFYSKKCQTCHGPEGNGNPGMAKALNVVFKELGSADIQKKSDADLKKVVMEGSGKMKAVSGLMPAEVDDVVAHVRSLKK